MEMEHVVMEDKNILLRVSFAKLSLLMLLFIEAMNYGVIYPVLAYQMDLTANGAFFPYASDYSRVFTFALLIFSYMLAWFFGTFLENKISTTKGAKQYLFSTVFLVIIGCLLTAYALYIHHFMLLILSRVISGVGASMQQLSQDTLVHSSETQQQRELMIKRVSWVMCAGIVFGPVFGAVFADANVYHYFSPATPFLLMAFLTSIACVMMLFSSISRLFDCTLHQRVTMSFVNFFRGIKLKQLRPYVLSFSLFLFAWGCFYYFIPLYLDELFHYSVTSLSLLIFYFSFGFACGLLLLKPFHKAMKSHRALLFTLIISAMFLCLLMLALHSFIIVITAVSVMGLLIGILYPSLLIFLINDAHVDHRVAIKLIFNRLLPLTFAVTALVCGLLGHLSMGVHLLLMMLSLLLLISYFLLCFKKSSYCAA